MRASAVDVAQLEGELALLREENARLKVERARPASVAGVVERARALEKEVVVRREEEGGWEALAKATALRDSVDALCADVQNALETVRRRLAVDGELPEHVPVEAPVSLTARRASVAGREPRAASWHIDTLRELVYTNLEAWRKEWEDYLGSLEELTEDGFLPESLQAAVRTTFGDLIEPRAG